MEWSHEMRVGVLGVVGVLVTMLALRLGIRSIRFEGLLAAPGSTGVSAERVQLLVVTLLTGLRYAISVVSARGTVMPELSRPWLMVFGVSCAIYVVVKAIRMFSLSRDEARRADDDQVYG